ncbi:MAG: FliO/MopB family protein [Nitrospira sp.]
MIDLWESLFRTGAALAIVLVLMGIVALAFRRLMGDRLGTVGGRPLVQILATGYIAPRKTVTLVSVAGEYLIVGTTATDLVPLGRISDSAHVKELLAQTTEAPTAQTTPAANSAFSSWIRRRLLIPLQFDKDVHG